MGWARMRHTILRHGTHGWRASNEKTLGALARPASSWKHAARAAKAGDVSTRALRLRRPGLPRRGRKRATWTRASPKTQVHVCRGALDGGPLAACRRPEGSEGRCGMAQGARVGHTGGLWTWPTSPRPLGLWRCCAARWRLVPAAQGSRAPKARWRTVRFVLLRATRTRNAPAWRRARRGVVFPGRPRPAVVAAASAVHARRPPPQRQCPAPPPPGLPVRLQRLPPGAALLWRQTPAAAPVRLLQDRAPPPPHRVHPW